MQDEVSETENIRRNLSIERQFAEGCEELLDVEQIFIRQGTLILQFQFFSFSKKKLKMIIYFTTLQCNTMQYNAIQCNTMQYNGTIQYNTIRYIKIQYNTIQYYYSFIYLFFNFTNTLTIVRNTYP